MDRSDRADGRLSPLGLLDLVVVYVVWGSTFLAMRIGVRPGSGFAPWLFGGTRVLAAGVLLVLLAWALRRPLGVSRKEGWALVASGNLIWVSGHGLLLWAEQFADSGYAALFIASFPIWAALYDAVLDRRPPSWLLGAALAVGFLGIVLLMVPGLGAPRHPPLVFAALVAAPVAWAAGFTLQKRRAPGVSAFTSSAYQHLAAVPLFLLLGWVLGEPRPDPTRGAWLAWGYLVLFGSVLAFTAAHGALRLLPTRIAMTYGYVNPVVAVVLGHLVLAEPVPMASVAGAALVLIGVYGVFRDRHAGTAVRGTPRTVREPPT